MTSLSNTGFHTTMEILEKTKETLLTQPVFEDLMRHLPSGAELSISLEDRLYLTISLVDNELQLKEVASECADLELLLKPEGVRRLMSQTCPDLLSLGKELTKGTLAGYLQLRLKSDFKELHRKGYTETLKKLGLLAQGELMQQGLILASKAQILALEYQEKIKNRFFGSKSRHSKTK